MARALRAHRRAPAGGRARRTSCVISARPRIHSISSLAHAPRLHDTPTAPLDRLAGASHPARPSRTHGSRRLALGNQPLMAALQPLATLTSPACRCACPGPALLAPRRGRAAAQRRRQVRASAPRCRGRRCPCLRAASRLPCCLQVAAPPERQRLQPDGSKPCLVACSAGTHRRARRCVHQAALLTHHPALHTTLPAAAAEPTVGVFEELATGTQRKYILVRSDAVRQLGSLTRSGDVVLRCQADTPLPPARSHVTAAREASGKPACPPRWLSNLRRLVTPRSLCPPTPHTR